MTASSIEGTRPDLTSRLMSVLVALWYEIDHHDGVGASRFFTPDATLRFANARFSGAAEIDRVYADRSARGPRVSRHIVANLHVLEASETHARAISVLLLFGEDGEAPRPTTSPALIGDVLDEFRLRDGRWMITSRWIQNMFVEPTTELAVPQGGSDD